MKVRFYPKKSYVEGVLTKAIQEEDRIISECDTKLAQLNNGAGLWEDPSPTLQVKKYAQETVKSLQSNLNALQSHEPPEVMAEIELF